MILMIEFAVMHTVPKSFLLGPPSPVKTNTINRDFEELSCVATQHTFERRFQAFRATFCPKLDSRDVSNVFRQTFTLRVPIVHTQADRMRQFLCPTVPCACIPMVSLLAASQSRTFYSARNDWGRVAIDTKTLL